MRFFRYIFISAEISAQFVKPEIYNPARHSRPRLIKMKVPHGLQEIPEVIDYQCFASVINAINILSTPSSRKKKILLFKDALSEVVLFSFFAKMQLNLFYFLRLWLESTILRFIWAFFDITQLFNLEDKWSCKKQIICIINKLVLNYFVKASAFETFESVKRSATEIFRNLT